MPKVWSGEGWIDLTSEWQPKPLRIIKFSAEWCGPCKAIQPYFGQLAAANWDSCDYVTVDIERDEDFLSEFTDVQSLPTFVFLRDGAESVDRVMGSTRQNLEEAHNMLHAGEQYSSVLPTA